MLRDWLRSSWHETMKLKKAMFIFLIERRQPTYSGALVVLPNAVRKRTKDKNIALSDTDGLELALLFPPSLIDFVAIFLSF